MAKKNRPKKINLEDLGGFVFSTNPEFEPPAFEEGNEEPLTPGEQLLELYFEKKEPPWGCYSPWASSGCYWSY